MIGKGWGISIVKIKHYDKVLYIRFDFNFNIIHILVPKKDSLNNIEAFNSYLEEFCSERYNERFILTGISKFIYNKISSINNLYKIEDSLSDEIGGLHISNEQLCECFISKHVNKI